MRPTLDGRADRLARDHRARRRLGRRRHPHDAPKRDGDDYVVNGAKTYITSGVRADFVVTAVRTGDAGAHGISLLVVEKGTPGFTVVAPAGEDGLAAARTPPSCPTPTSACRPRNLVGAENTGFVQIAQNFVSERIGLAVQAYASRAALPGPHRRSGAATARRSAGR